MTRLARSVRFIIHRAVSKLKCLPARRTMRTQPTYLRLSNLMGGYLNQDFDLCYDNDDDAIRDYATTQRVSDVKQAVEELDRLLAGPPEGLLERFKDEVSRWDFIIGETDDEARAWLLKARRLLTDASTSA